MVGLEGVRMLSRCCVWERRGWGLGAGKAEGVERTLEILEEETRTATRLLGAREVRELEMRHINAKAVERYIYDRPVGLGEDGEVKKGVKAKL